jgi:hypothetical protein
MQKHPHLTKDASSALVDLGDAINTTVTSDEIEVLVRGTLLQDAFARNSCLQALQVCPMLLLHLVYRNSRNVVL